MLALLGTVLILSVKQFFGLSQLERDARDGIRQVMLSKANDDVAKTLTFQFYNTLIRTSECCADNLLWEFEKLRAISNQLEYYLYCVPTLLGNPDRVSISR